MKFKAVSGIMLTLLSIGMLTLAFSIKPVKASATIYIRADGSVDPTTANITTADNITYIFIDNNYDSIVIERSNIVVDGAGYTLQGTGSGTGIDLSGRENVTIKNMEIKAFYNGVGLSFSNNNTIFENHISANDYHGIKLLESSNNNISRSNITTNNNYGIWLYGSSKNNTIFGNDITDNYAGAGLYESSNNNTIFGNDITNNSVYGLVLFKSSNNTLHENHVANNGQYGIRLFESSNNSVYHNNFINNTNQAYDDVPSSNDYHDLTLLEGNYWSDYAGTDDGSGVGKHSIAGDRIGDTLIPHPDTDYDFYPLMSPWPFDVIPPEIVVISPQNVTYTTTSISLIFTINETTSWIGYSLDDQPNVTILGNTTLTALANGPHNIVVYANDTFGNIGSSDKVYFDVAEPSPVGGISIPVNKLELLVPYITLVSAIVLAVSVTYVKTRKKK